MKAGADPFVFNNGMIFGVDGSIDEMYESFLSIAQDAPEFELEEQKKMCELFSHFLFHSGSYSFKIKGGGEFVFSSNPHPKSPRIYICFPGKKKMFADEIKKACLCGGKNKQCWVTCMLSGKKCALNAQKKMVLFRKCVKIFFMQ